MDQVRSTMPREDCLPRPRQVQFGKGVGMYGVIYLRELQSPVIRALKPHTKDVLFLLWSMQDSKTGMAWPSQYLIRDTLGVSRSSVTRAIRELEQAGLLERVPGRGRSLRYRMLEVPGTVDSEPSKARPLSHP